MFDFRVLSINPMNTTKNSPTEDRQRKLEGIKKFHSTKILFFHKEKQGNTEKDSNQEIRENKYQTDRKKSLLINCFKCNYILQTKGKDWQNQFLKI